MSTKRPSIAKPINQYGQLESSMRKLRAGQTKDLHYTTWQKDHPNASFRDWQELVSQHILDCFQYDPGELNLNPEVIETKDRGSFMMDTVLFNTTPWHRLEAYFLYPKNQSTPQPAILCLHAWGGPMVFGKDRIVNSGRDCEVLKKHRQEFYDGKYLAEEYVKQGYCVLVIDNFHFGDRIPKGTNEIQEEIDLYNMPTEELEAYDWVVRDALTYSMHQIFWAGITWPGLNFWDDKRCIDYLFSRPEVDVNHIGLTGLSVGGWRCNLLAALDSRIKASVSVGWMTEGDYQQQFNVRGAVGPFCMIPGVWNRLDISDIPLLSLGRNPMLVVGTHDHLFPVEGVEAAKDYLGQIAQDLGENANFYRPNTEHCYNLDVQEKAFAWFKDKL